MKSLLTLGVATLAVVGVVGAGVMTVSALDGQQNTERAQAGPRDGSGHGYGRQASLESRAALFGMTVDELQTALETKTMSQIAVERGMSEETFRAKMKEAAQARWEARGLSADEIAKRVTERDARHAANAADHVFGSGDGNHQGGYGRGR